MTNYLKRDRKRTISLDTLSACLITYVSVSAVFPPLRTIGPNTWLCVYSLAGWLALSIFQDPEFFVMGSVEKWMKYVFIAYTMIFPFLFDTVTLANRYASLMIFPLGSLIYDYYMSRGKKRILNGIVVLTLLFSVMTYAATIIALIQSPWISRSIKSSGEYSFEISRQGIGGYEFIYFICLLSPLTMNCALSMTKGWKRLCFVAWTAEMLLIILSNYFTALLLAFIGSTLAIIASMTSNKNRNKSLLGLLLIIMVFVFAGKDIINWLVDIITQLAPSGKTSERLSEIDASLFEGIWKEFIVDRWPTMLISMNSWKEHPIFGLAVFKETVEGRFLLNVGQHSHILDTFALFGTAIGALNCYLLFRPIRNKTLTKAFKIPLLVVFSGVLLFNNGTPSLAVCTYLIAPTFVRWVKGYRLQLARAKTVRKERVKTLAA